MALKVDFAETFLDAAGLAVPNAMQGRSVVPVLRGHVPADWRTSMYYRYYHDPGDHNTRALRRAHDDPQADLLLTARLKAELLRLEHAVRDEDQLANEQLPDGVDGTVARLRGK